MWRALVMAALVVSAAGTVNAEGGSVPSVTGRQFVNTCHGRDLDGAAVPANQSAIMQASCAIYLAGFLHGLDAMNAMLSHPDARKVEFFHRCQVGITTAMLQQAMERHLQLHPEDAVQLVSLSAGFGFMSLCRDVPVP